MRRLVRSLSNRTVLAAALLAAGLSLSQSAFPALAQSDSKQSADPVVRIRLARTFSNAAQLFVSRNPGGYQASFTDGNGPSAPLRLDSGQLIEFQYSAVAKAASISRKDDAHLVCRLAAGQTVTLTPDDFAASDAAPDSFCLQQNSNRAAQHYRGAIQVTALENGTLRVINRVLLEDYLKGVVGPEIGESAPLEALKAQAIAARTYTIKNLGKLALTGADLDDTNRCQNYLGVDAENWRCRTAVEQTAGEVLAYQGDLIDAVYATDCGGMTAQGDEPYLKPVSDPDCAAAAPWSVSVTASTLQSALEKSGIVGVANIDYVAVHDRDASGRAATLTCTDEATGETEDVSATLVRKALGYDLLRSTLFRVSMTPDSPDLLSSVQQKTPHGSCGVRLTGTVTFTGKGWGHGLGMCQHGAVQMARLESATDEQILHHFYTGVEIVPLTANLVAGNTPGIIPIGQSAWSGPGLAAYAASARKHRIPRDQSAAARLSGEQVDRSHAAGSPKFAAAAASTTSPTPAPAALFPRRGF